MKIEKLKPGMVVFDNGFALSPMGRVKATWRVKILEVDLPGNRVRAIWNDWNPERWYPRRIAEKWSSKPREARKVTP